MDLEVWTAAAHLGWRAPWYDENNKVEWSARTYGDAIVLVGIRFDDKGNAVECKEFTFTCTREV